MVSSDTSYTAFPSSSKYWIILWAQSNGENNIIRESIRQTRDESATNMRDRVPRRPMCIVPQWAEDEIFRPGWQSAPLSFANQNPRARSPSIRLPPQLLRSSARIQSGHAHASAILRGGHTVLSGASSDSITEVHICTLLFLSLSLSLWFRWIPVSCDELEYVRHRHGRR